jgi:neuronal cell adhesion protein
MLLCDKLRGSCDFSTVCCSYLIEPTTRNAAAIAPDHPDFKWYRLPSDNGLASVKVVWLPDIDGRPGSHFFVKYK